MVENVGKKKPLISICISTFNRSEKVYNLVHNILNYKGDEIEVIVVDNFSPDDTNIVLSKITDDRFLFTRNDENIGPLLSGLKALSLATGEYAFICLDKDRIDQNSINGLISRLNDDTDVVFGYCSLNLQQVTPDVIYEQGFPSVYNMAYLSGHPSGVFFKAEIFKNLPMLKNITEKEKSFAFYTDLINAEMTMLGKSRQINLPAFYTETKDESKVVRSFTYTEKDVFFSPGKRMVEFDMYVNSAQHLGLSNNELLKIIYKLYKHALISSTFGYKNIMSDHSACAHYGMTTRKVSLSEQLKLDFAFSSHFLKQRLTISYVTKLYIILDVHVRLLFNIVFKK